MIHVANFVLINCRGLLALRLMPYAIRKTVVAECEEPVAFWEALGGKGDYQSEPASSPQPAAHEPQLLLFSEAAPDGLEDISGYTQDDLDDEAIFLLDAFYTVLLQTFPNAHIAFSSRLSKRYHSLPHLQACHAAKSQPRLTWGLRRPCCQDSMTRFD